MPGSRARAGARRSAKKSGKKATRASPARKKPAARTAKRSTVKKTPAKKTTAKQKPAKKKTAKKTPTKKKTLTKKPSSTRGKTYHGRGAVRTTSLIKKTKSGAYRLSARAVYNAGGRDGDIHCYSDGTCRRLRIMPNGSPRWM